MGNLLTGEIRIQEEKGLIKCTITLCRENEYSKPVSVNNKADKRFMVLADKIIQENLMEPHFSTLIWCKKLGIGRTCLFDRVKQCTGMTPNTYIRYVKMKKSRDLIAESSHTINEIANLLGFCSAAYFCKCFKDHFEMSPVEYRKTLSRINM